MDLLASYASPFFYNELPDTQAPAPSYPVNPDETPPMNPSPVVPGSDAPEVSTGSRMDDDIPAQDIDEEDVSEVESENP